MSNIANTPLVEDVRENHAGSSKLFVFRPDHMDDAALWNAFRSGDERAFIAIFDRFTKLLYNYGYKIAGESELVKDTVQELFIELWKNHRQLGPTTSIKYYLFKSLRRKLVRQLVKTQKSLLAKASLEHVDEAFPSHEFLLIHEQATLEQRQRVLSMLDTLTRRQREAVFLRYFEELGYDTIAAIMELNKQTVYNLINKALDTLKHCAFLLPAVLLDQIL